MTIFVSYIKKKSVYKIVDIFYWNKLKYEDTTNNNLNSILY